MSPVANGRHCAACQKTVVDFTLKTDAEILAHLAIAANGPICGRFAAGQLERPLQRAAPAAPTRWRAWLAAAVAVWGLREASGSVARAQVLVEFRPGSAPSEHTHAPTAGSSAARTELVLRGEVVDAATGEKLPGVTVLITGTTIGTSTNYDGSFALPVPAGLALPSGVAISVSLVGYVVQRLNVRTEAAATPLTFRLAPDGQQLGGIVVVGGISSKPWPWHPRRFYYWGKYWLARPFQNW